MKFLDNLGLGYFWQKIKAYIDGKDATNVKSVNDIMPNPAGNVLLVAENIFYDDAGTPLGASNVQDAITKLDKDMRYNAIYTFDATVQSAPPNLPRGYNWHIEMVGDMQQDHNYVRYFYTNEEDAKLDTKGSPNAQAAVARWVIDGKQMRFEYLTNGVPSTIIELTDTDGSVLIPSFRPIASRCTWFFGAVQADDFPTNDNAQSILDINVWGLSVMLGNTFNLETESKQIVGAINEINEKSASVRVQEEPTAADALLYSQNNPNVFVFVARS